MASKRTKQPPRLLPQAFAAIAVALLAFAAGAALAQSGMSSPAERAVSPGFRFTQTTGETLYKNVCQACHMPDGKGATGAGTYPPLAADQNLGAAGYPVSAIVNGLRGMPPVGYMMSDEQVAAVVNYVRTHFGNNYQDAVTAADVKAVRPASRGQ
jgi:mono/diheme cytochrome c family protein